METQSFIKYIIAGFIGITIGFFIGRTTINQETEIEYIQLPVITGGIDKEGLKPVREITPDNPELPMKRDTIYLDSLIYVTQVVDTAAIIADYVQEREYQLTLFDSQETGKLSVSPTIQYNKLIGLDYSFTPIIQQKTIHKQKVWMPFISGSYATFGYVGVGGGIYYHDIGVEYQYLKGIDNSGHLFGVKYKF